VNVAITINASSIGCRPASFNTFLLIFLGVGVGRLLMGKYAVGISASREPDFAPLVQSATGTVAD
jgi:hypothetical protein